MVVVTGTADGVDATVLKTAIEEDKPVISVVAGGFLHIYPQNNVDLIERVSEIGLVISENPPDVKPMPYFFPIRNRIIAGLAEGVLVSSAGIKSGALYTAEYALEYGKDVFAIPYSVGVKTGEGCNELIKKGANLVDKPEDILSFYGYEVKEEQTELVGLEKEIIELLKEEELHVEVLAEKLKKQAYEIIPTLQILEIKGYVYKNGTNEYGSIK
jgi:DNA processing protein